MIIHSNKKTLLEKKKIYC